MLVNNAGIGAVAPVELMPMEAIRALFETNFFGAVRMTQAILPSLRERRAGAIVNVTSVMGRVTLPTHAYYTVTKFALAALTETLAMEVRPLGIRVTSVEPGVSSRRSDKRGTAIPRSRISVRRRQARARFGAQLGRRPLPVVVAEAIFKAATEDGPMHVPCLGDDAVAWIRAHAEPDAWASSLCGAR